MITVYGDLRSGNSYKVMLLCDLLQLEFQWKHVDLMKGETRTEAFRKINPNGFLPVIRLENGEMLDESNAILAYLAEGSAWFPEERLARAKTLAWLMYEQNQIEPNIGSARFLLKAVPEGTYAKEVLEDKQARGFKALHRLNAVLESRSFLMGSDPTIADIAVFGYSHLAEDAGLNFDECPNLIQWMIRIRNLPGYRSLDEGLVATMPNGK